LPVLEALTAHILTGAELPLANVRIVCVQHLLETTGSLLEAIVRLGCPAKNIHVLGKLYSTSQLVEDRAVDAGYDILKWEGEVLPGRYQSSIRHNIQRLWGRAHSAASKRDRLVLVLDDGGRCRQYYPVWLDRDKVMAVEQTTSGLRPRRTGGWIPTVEVAGSAAKKVLEPPAVTESILKFVVPRIEGQNKRRPIGVAGLGTVGGDVARRLVKAGYEVYVYDKHPDLRLAVAGAKWCSSMKSLMERSAAIVGCAGEDLLKDADWLDKVRGRKILASCSSEDVEFRSLLSKANAAATSHNPLLDRTVHLLSGELCILRGGFPANFTGTKNSGPVSLIQVTRGLLLAGLVQATTLHSSNGRHLPRRIMLDPALQAVVARSFLTPQRRQLLASVADRAVDPDWLATHSSGVRLG
jgi:S-adenosylhomocysteine hydrolase